MITERGRLAWQTATGYGQRSLVETTMGCYKVLIGPRLRARFRRAANRGCHRRGGPQSDAGGRAPEICPSPVGDRIAAQNRRQIARLPASAPTRRRSLTYVGFGSISGHRVMSVPGSVYPPNAGICRAQFLTRVPPMQAVGREPHTAQYGKPQTPGIRAADEPPPEQPGPCLGSLTAPPAGTPPPPGRTGQAIARRNNRAPRNRVPPDRATAAPTHRAAGAGVADADRAGAAPGRQ
jgi:hypothetical protein